jgi:hypothetical protein
VCRSKRLYEYLLLVMRAKVENICLLLVTSLKTCGQECRFQQEYVIDIAGPCNISVSDDFSKPSVMTSRYQVSNTGHYSSVIRL